MKLGIIDIGSNSIRFMVGNKVEGEWQWGPKRLWTTRLGSKENNLALQVDRMDASLQALAEVLALGKEQGVEEFKVYATSAVREASNKDEFLERVKTTLGLSIVLLSGEEEGRYSFLGAAQDYTKDGKHALVFDLGGGSLELALGSAEGVYWSQSYPVGAVRMKPISDEGPQRIWEELKGLWPPLPIKGPFSEFVGVGGTITTLAAMDLQLENYDALKVQGHILSREKIEAQALFLRYMSEEELAAVKGLPASRRDIIVTGCEIIAAFMDAYDIGHIVVSDADGMEGYGNQF